MTANAVSPSATLRQMTTAYWTSRAVHTLARLSVPDLLARGPRTSDDLAEALQAHTASLDRLLRAAVGLGLLAHDDSHRYHLTPLGDLLRSDVPGSMRGWAVMLSEPWYRAGWDNLVHGVLTGEPGFDKAHGTDFWSYLEHNRVAGRQFNAGMTSASSMRTQALLEAHDFAQDRTVVDVGGGHGILLAGVLNAYPTTRGVLFDRPHVVDGATSTLERQGVADRCQVVGGDFFAEIPGDGDVYLLAVIVHDWADEPATAILKSCRRAMSADARLLLVEQVIPDDDAFHQSKLDDLNMLVTCRGRERSVDEFQSLLASAGLQLTRVSHTAWPWSVIAAVPA